MNERFQFLLSCVERWSIDESDIMNGNAILCEDFLPSEENIYHSLLSPSEYDNVTQEFLQVVCSAFSVSIGV